MFMINDYLYIFYLKGEYDMYIKPYRSKFNKNIIGIPEVKNY